MRSSARTCSPRTEIAYRLRQARDAAGITLFVGTEGSVQLSAIDIQQPDVILTVATDRL